MEPFVLPIVTPLVSLFYVIQFVMLTIRDANDLTELMPFMLTLELHDTLVQLIKAPGASLAQQSRPQRKLGHYF